MASLVPAARQLIQQVQGINDKVKVSPHGEVDGFGLIRSIEFDARTSKWLAPALEATADNRVRRIDYEGKGRAVVTFVGNTVADRRHPFEIEKALSVLTGQD